MYDLEEFAQIVTDWIVEIVFLKGAGDLERQAYCGPVSVIEYGNINRSWIVTMHWCGFKNLLCPTRQYTENARVEFELPIGPSVPETVDPSGRYIFDRSNDPVPMLIVFFPPNVKKIRREDLLKE